MKKLSISIIAILLTISSFAQRNITAHIQPINSIDPTNHTFSGNNTNAKISAIGSTEILSNIPDSTALTLYTVGTNDSGYVTGTDYWNDQAFAERYDFNGEDSSMQVIGVYAQFGGTVNPASTRTVTFNVWSPGVKVIVSDSLAYSAFPDTVMDSLNVPVTQIGIGAVVDTVKAFLFATPTAFLSGSFFVGYNINYSFASLNGDTIGLTSSVDGSRKSKASTISVQYTIFGDTVVTTTVNVQNATMGSDLNWYDNYTQNDSLFNDLAIYPIVVINNPTSVKGITKSGLTFFGNYPNPAVNNTNIKFSLANNADVSIQITDMAGRDVNTIKETNLSTGEHIIPVNTSALPSGDYLYLIRTSGGGGMAGKMTIVK